MVNHSAQYNERLCRIIAALYQESGLTDDQRALLTNIHRFER
jgi:cellobiose phosphorylase